MGGNDDRQFDAFVLEIVVDIHLIVGVGHHLEIAGGGQPVDQGLGLGVFRLVEHGDLGVTDVGADGETEQQDQCNRHGQHQRQRDGVAEDVDELLL